jgi:hypothetical protein
MTVKIENYEGTADTFNFPHNPQTFDDEIETNYSVTNIDFQRQHIFVTGGGVEPKKIILVGHFDGTNRFSDYRTLSKNFIGTQLKKLYFESDKFYLGLPKRIKKVNSGGRTNFVDYVATFESIIGILFDDTQQTATLASAKTNDGNIDTYVEEITGTITSGASNVVITDDLGNEVTIPADSFLTGDAFKLTFVKMVDSGSSIFVSEYNYTTINTIQIKSVQTTGGLGYLQIPAGGSTSAFTISNLSSYQIKFRNGWSA